MFCNPIDTTNTMNNNNKYQPLDNQMPLELVSHASTGTIKPLIHRQESSSIPIPGRAQSHDDIHLISNSPRYESFSPNSSRYISYDSPGSSPFTQYGSQLRAGRTVASRAISRTESPLSSSVPTIGSGIVDHRLA